MLEVDSTSARLFELEVFFSFDASGPKSSESRQARRISSLRVRLIQRKLR